MNSLFKLAVIVRAIDHLSRPVRVMKRAVQGLNSFMANARGALQWGQKITMAGAMVAAAAAVIVAGLSGPISASMNFNEAMSGVAAVSQATAQEMAALTSTAKELGASTSFSAMQAAGAMKFLGQAGFKTNEIIAAMPGTLAMARAGATDLATSADIASNILSGFGLEATQMTATADLLTATFTSSNTDLRMLGETMKYVAPVARAAGVDLRTAAAMAGLLGNAGIQGSMAGTSLASMLTRLSAPTGSAASALAALGVSATDSQGNVRNMVDVLEDLARATSALPDGRKLGFIKEIFGEEAGKSALELIEQAGAGNLADYVKQLEKVGGTAKRVAEQMNDNLAGDVITFKSALEGLFITLGDKLEPVLRPLVQNVTNLTRSLAAWAEENPRLTAGILTVLGALGGLLAILAPIMLAAGGLASAFGFIATGIHGAAIAFGFMRTQAALALRGLGALLISAGRSVALFTAQLMRAVTSQNLFAAAAARGGWANLIQINALKARTALLSAVSAGRTWIVTNAQMAAGAITSLPARIAAMTIALKANSLAALANARASLFTLSGWRSMGSGILTKAATGLRMVGVAIRGIGLALAANPIGVAVMAIAATATLLYKYWAPISGFFKGLFAGIWEGLGPLQPAIEKIGAAVSTLLAPIGWVIDAVSSILTPVEDVGGAAESMGQRFGLAIGKMLRTILEFPAKLVSVGGEIVATIWNGIQSAWSSLTGWFTGAGEEVKQSAASISLFDAGVAMISSLVDGIASMALAPVKAVKGIAEKLKALWPFGGNTEQAVSLSHTVKNVAATTDAVPREVVAVKQATGAEVAPVLNRVQEVAKPVEVTNTLKEVTTSTAVETIREVHRQAEPAPLVAKLEAVKEASNPVSVPQVVREAGPASEAVREITKLSELVPVTEQVTALSTVKEASPLQDKAPVVGRLRELAAGAVMAGSVGVTPAAAIELPEPVNQLQVAATAPQIVQEAPKPAPLPAVTSNSLVQEVPREALGPVHVELNYSPKIQVTVEGGENSDDLKETILAAMRESSSEVADIIAEELERRSRMDF